MNDTVSEKPLRVAVIGVGRMGQHHARVYSQIPGCKLAAICDANQAAAEKMAALYNCPAFTDINEMVRTLTGANKLDAATIATPTVYHLALAQTLLNAGIDVLVEKPLAPNVAEARAIVDLAQQRGRILQVGHTERFNPAFRALKPYQLSPQFVEVHRISPMTFRSIDVGVVLDLMIHDIDIVQHLVGRPVTEVSAVGVSVIGDHEDIANARLTFANGCIANLTASRLALKSERKMRLFSPNAYVTVDYHRKSGAIITRTANEEQLERVRQQVREGQVADLMQLNYPELVKYEDLKVTDIEPLRAEQDSFLNAVRTRGTPEVTGEDGFVAVDIAARIVKCIQEHKWESMPAVLTR
ncbi:MAG: Gfo/Idh/MocA family oxidoreductase [Phycisphaerae bacterium]